MKYLAPIVLVMAAVLIIAFLIDKTSAVGKDSNVYIRYVACALSIPPEVRDTKIIDECWAIVTKEAGHTVRRYDQ